MFIRNQWYVAGWDREIGRAPFARMVCGEPILLYRKLDGGIVAMADLCPHRLMPLSKGTLEGDNIRCRYHGFAFDGAGRCVDAAALDRAPTNFAVRKLYPAVERHRFVWVWMGEAEKADPALIADLWPCSKPGWTFDGGVDHVKADYRLMIDNLMDLSHESFVHPGSIGQREIIEAPLETKTVGERVTVTRWMKDIEAPPFWRTALGKPGNVDRWQVCEFVLPSAVLIDVGVALAGTGAPEGDRSQGVNGYVVDFMTPETDRTFWYFWGMARNFKVDDQGFTARFREQQAGVFAEDIEVLEAQQRSMELHADAKLRAFSIDAGGVHARRLIDAKMKAEASA